MSVILTSSDDKSFTVDLSAVKHSGTIQGLLEVTNYLKFSEKLHGWRYLVFFSSHSTACLFFSLRHFTRIFVSFLMSASTYHKSWKNANFIVTNFRQNSQINSKFWRWLMLLIAECRRGIVVRAPHPTDECHWRDSREGQAISLQAPYGNTIFIDYIRIKMSLDDCDHVEVKFNWIRYRYRLSNGWRITRMTP